MSKSAESRKVFKENYSILTSKSKQENITQRIIPGFNLGLRSAFLKLMAHVHGDSFIKESEEFEGLSVSIATKYLSEFTSKFMEKNKEIGYEKQLTKANKHVEQLRKNADLIKKCMSVTRGRAVQKKIKSYLDA